MKYGVVSPSHTGDETTNSKDYRVGQKSFEKNGIFSKDLNYGLVSPNKYLSVNSPTRSPKKYGAGSYSRNYVPIKKESNLKINVFSS